VYGNPHDIVRIVNSEYRSYGVRGLGCKWANWKFRRVWRSLKVWDVYDGAGVVGRVSGFWDLLFGLEGRREWLDGVAFGRQADEVPYHSLCCGFDCLSSGSLGRDGTDRGIWMSFLHSSDIRERARPGWMGRGIWVCCQIVKLIYTTTSGDNIRAFLIIHFSGLHYQLALITSTDPRSHPHSCE